MVLNGDQQRRSWYMFFFQTPIAELAVAHNEFAFLERLWSEWSPGWTFSREDFDYLKACFGIPGTLESALGYYRALFNPALHDPALAEDQAKIGVNAIEVPTLYLHGENDGCIDYEISRGMESLFPKGLERKIVPGAGHFMLQEEPEIVNRFIFSFLEA